MKLIPIYYRDEFGVDTLVGRRTEAEVLALGNLHLRRRNGVIKRAYLIARQIGLIHLERDGYCRTQTLTCGKVFALVGTPGCEDDGA